MNTFEETEIYKQALLQAEKYHSDTIGLTDYAGIQQSDKIYPKMLNFQTILLLQICTKVTTLEERISSLEAKIDLLKKFASGKDVAPYKPTSYKSW